MASVSLRRLANNLTLSFKLDTRSRTFGLTLTNTERTRRRRDHHTSPLSYHYSQQYARAFSTHPSYRAAVPSAPNATPGNTTSAPRAAPSNYSSRPAAQTTGTPATQTFQRPRDPPPSTARSTAASTPNPSDHPLRELNKGLSDAPPNPTSTTEVDWTSSYHGLSNEAFSSDASAILLAPLNQDDIEIKPDGILYLPEIKYRRILNKAFGPGAWGLAPRGETIVTAKSVTREYALLVHGRLVSIARGEQDYFDPEGIPTATEGCKSNALMRCCKDLGVASELWDPRFIRKWLKDNARDVWVEHTTTKRKRKMTMRKDDEVKYPFKETKM